MNIYKLGGIALLAIMAPTAFANTTTIDFEDPAIIILPQLASFEYEDVIFSSTGRDGIGSSSLDVVTNPDVLEFSTDISGYYLQTHIMDFETLTFSFVSSDVTSFAFNFAGNENDWELTAYNDTDSIIGTQTITALADGLRDNHGTTFGITSELDYISYATLTDLGTPGFMNFEDVVAVDNFTYTTSQAITSPIPEPSAYLLMMGGLGMVGFMAYRRRQQEKNLVEG